MNNNTTKIEEDASDLSTKIVYALFGVLGMTGNALVLLVIALVPDDRGITNLFIANQSLIDLCASVFLIAGYVLPPPPLPSGRTTLAKFLCRYWYTNYPFWSLIVVSSLNLALMALERFYAIFYPIRFRTHTSSRCLKLLAFIPWTIGFLFQLTLALFAHVEGNKCYLQFFIDPIFKTVFQPIAVSLEFILPVIMIIFVYTAIAIKLRSKTIRGREKADFGSRFRRATDYRSQARRNTIKTMIIVSICFILCWFMNQILLSIFTCCGVGVDFTSLIYRISVIMGFGNMWINPFIYAFQYRWFQKGLRKIFCKSSERSPAKEVKSISKALKMANTISSV